MTVRELMEKLGELDPNAPVWTIDTCACCMWSRYPVRP